MPKIGKIEKGVVRGMSPLCKQYVPDFAEAPEDGPGNKLSKNDAGNCP
jgi:hypothetical protein